MTIESIMLTDVQTVGPDDTVEKAVELMIDRNVRNLPVIDEQGRLIGTFSTYRLVNLLLPVAATMEHGLKDLSFVHDTLEDVKERLRELRYQRVGDVMRTKDIPIAHPDTSLIEGALLLHQFRTRVPVTDKNGKLLGVVTYKGYLQAFLDAIREDK